MVFGRCQSSQQVGKWPNQQYLTRFGRARIVFNDMHQGDWAAFSSSYIPTSTLSGTSDGIRSTGDVGRPLGARQWYSLAFIILWNIRIVYGLPFVLCTQMSSPLRDFLASVACRIDYLFLLERDSRFSSLSVR